MLRDDINNAVKDAMRARDERKLSTLRMVNSTIKNADIAARGEGKPPLSTRRDLLVVFQKMIKQRQESVELYDKGAGRARQARSAPRSRSSRPICRSRCRMTRSTPPYPRRRRDQRRRHEGHGPGHRGAPGAIRRPDGFRQGQRPGEGGAGGVVHNRSSVPPSAQLRTGRGDPYAVQLRFNSGR